MLMETDAVIDTTGHYRYSLTRIWDYTLGKVVFILLNPSTADETEDDRTSSKCIGFAQQWGFGSITNLYV